MAANNNEEQAFLNRLTEITEANLTNDQFGVSELASKMGISRSHMHRRLKTQTNQSTSQFICTVRLNKAMKMLQQKEATAAEIAYEVGFSSPAYFNRCFHKLYGFPPGEVKKRFPLNISEEDTGFTQRFFIRHKPYLFSFIALLVLVLAGYIYTHFINDIFPLNYLSKKDKELSIIVLPFKNLSDNPNNQYFADGITEDILNNLYWISSLRVVSRTSGEHFGESSLSVREIARKADVKYVLEGSVRIYDEKIRVSVQLIDAYREDHLWSTYFDRDLDDIIGVQDEIALQVASKLNAVLSENEIRLIRKNPTQNTKAYNYYLRGRFLLHKANSEQRFDFDKDGVINCIQYYEKAIAEDTSFAEAYAGLANAWFNVSAWGWFPASEGFPKSRNLCLTALEIDPDCAEAHGILGALLVWGQRNYEEGGKELKTSIQLNPNFATSRQHYAQYLMITGPIEEARRHINIAIDLEPYFWVVQSLSAWIYYFEGKHEKAIETCHVAGDLNPNFTSNKWLTFLNYAKLGEGEKAMKMLQTISKLRPNAEQYANEISESYNKSGIPGLFDWLIDMNKNKPVQVEGMNGSPFYIAWWNAINGNANEAVYWLERNMESQNRADEYFNLIATNPDFNMLHSDPRFTKIVDNLGLTPYHNLESK